MSAGDILNIVVVGDGAVGKTCLLHAYTDESFTNFYQPTIYDKESIEMTLDGRKHTIQLHDTAGQEDYDRIRQQFYKRAHCFLLCYAINNRISYENISLKWIPEITANTRVPIVLIATKLDLRKGVSSEVTTAEGARLARKINANSFIECSAKTDQNVKLAVEEAVRACFLGVPEAPLEESCWDKCWPL
ncbi:ras-like GTP-binding protein RhoL [Malaya genurostris]|uniref:ras-like GTP-binding protein RhoL n=1 Tax=Malaya genurostris TaxID=325434 RepID=UPI0026F3DFAB|nr:ras-like GTP-binding protein RhoL [Malaya genurostris]XP_058458192.1 ras-like GTP-binding protein RhoL [Malaya genurostris]XP_058458193.1 ras-like GTP-binding protein RhoL [Malaya genurostris]XP_058458194.1 ras-like GTP-binding protein RhoL [Malaya genurostris]